MPEQSSPSQNLVHSDISAFKLLSSRDLSLSSASLVTLRPCHTLKMHFNHAFHKCHVHLPGSLDQVPPLSQFSVSVRAQIDWASHLLPTPQPLQVSLPSLSMDIIIPMQLPPILLFFHPVWYLPDSISAQDELNCPHPCLWLPQVLSTGRHSQRQANLTFDSWVISFYASRTPYPWFSSYPDLPLIHGPLG